jgi:hypothetical protein
MANEALFDEPDDAVLEIVLSSDEEYQEGFAKFDAEDRRVRRQGFITRFLPGVEAGAVFALGLAMIGLTISSAVDIYVSNRVETRDIAVESQSGGQNMLLDELHFYSHLRSAAMAAICLLAVVIAVLVLSRWREEKHTRWSRPVAQAALAFGLLGVAVAVLIYTGVLAGIPASIPNSILNSQ